MPGIRTRRALLDRRDVTAYRGIPGTTVPCTLVDLAALLSRYDLARAVHNADVKHRVGADAVLRALERRPTADGAARLRAVLTGDTPILLSRLESRFRRLLREEGLPLPVTNRREQEGYVDCRWPGVALTVELDSFTYHRTRHAWEADRRRERVARARGDEFRRYTWGDVTEDRSLMVAELRPLLG